MHACVSEFLHYVGQTVREQSTEVNKMRKESQQQVQISQNQLQQSIELKKSANADLAQARQENLALEQMRRAQEKVAECADCAVFCDALRTGEVGAGVASERGKKPDRAPNADNNCQERWARSCSSNHWDASFQ